MAHDLTGSGARRKRVLREWWEENAWDRKQWKGFTQERTGRKGVTQERSSAIFCLDKGTAITCSKTQHLPGTQFLWLYNFAITNSVMISLQVGKWHGREAIYCSGLPVHLRTKHQTDISEVTLKVYNKHDYNLPLRYLPTSPPTRGMYMPFEVKFPW